jgi:hypothetical protein
MTTKQRSSRMDIYHRALDSRGDAYLITQQESEPARVEKIKAQAAERRNRRNTKRLEATNK